MSQEERSEALIEVLEDLDRSDIDFVLGEHASIPADAPGGEPLCRTARIVGVEGALDAPVVRYVDGLPAVVVEGGVGAALDVATAEPPACLETAGASMLLSGTERSWHTVTSGRPVTYIAIRRRPDAVDVGPMTTRWSD